MATAMALTLEYLLGVSPKAASSGGGRKIRFGSTSDIPLECDSQVSPNMSLQLLLHRFNDARHISDTPL